MKPAYTVNERIQAIDKLRDKMTERGHNAPKVAPLLKVAPQTINQWLRGDCLPNKTAVNRIKEYLKDPPPMVHKVDPPTVLSAEAIPWFQLIRALNQLSETIEKRLLN